MAYALHFTVGDKEEYYYTLRLWMGKNILVQSSVMYIHIRKLGRSQWPRGLRRWSTAARLLRSWVRIPPGAWLSVCCECCMLSGRGLCDELITRPEESYRTVMRLCV